MFSLPYSHVFPHISGMWVRYVHVFFVVRTDRSCSAFGFVGIIAQFFFVFVMPQQMQFHEVFAPLNFTIRVKQSQFAFETCSCVVVDHAWCNAALRVLRAATRLTVYRPLQVTRKAEFASTLRNTMVQRGKLKLMMSYLIWANILEKSIVRCQTPKEHRWL